MNETVARIIVLLVAAIAAGVYLWAALRNVDGQKCDRTQCDSCPFPCKNNKKEV